MCFKRRARLHRQLVADVLHRAVLAHALQQANDQHEAA